jgi:protocatechuate 3,4-dioxygenase beta subunit
MASRNNIQGSGYLRRRRSLLALLAGGAIAAKAPAQTALPGSGRPRCVLSPRQSEGPFFLDQRLHRSDIRVDGASDQAAAGIPLILQLRVLAADAACSPLVGLIVEIWHCNAAGAYSGVHDPRFGTVGSDFLRGYQVTDEEGAVRFATIYPGWYPGRAVHVHVKLRAPDGVRQPNAREWTSQLYFDDAITDRVHLHQPYVRAGGTARRPRNEQDALFRHGGKHLLLDVVSEGKGYIGRFDVGLSKS